MSVPVAAADDVVRTHAEAAANARPPLLIIEPLERFLDEQALGAGPLEVAPIGDGHSNVTYSLGRGDLEAVLRRPPRGPLPPSAHDVLREARVLRALHGRARVPRVLATCDDPRVIGTPFYVMERVAGHVVTDRVPAELDSPEDRRRMGEELIDALVELHAIDWRAAGLEGFGRPTGYLERQLKRFTGLWEHNRTRDLAAVERVGTWLGEHMPAEREATVVHGDFRLGNVMFAPSAPARLLAIFDWEMATIGDPLADIGYLSTYWTDRDDPLGGLFELSAVTREPGFPRRTELVSRYEERTGRSLSDIRWYQTLALWKAIVFMEGNYKRALTGTSDNPGNKASGEIVLELAGRAEETAFG